MKKKTSVRDWESGKRPLITGWLRDHGIAYLDMIVTALDEELVPRRDLDFAPETELGGTVDQYEQASTAGLVNERGPVVLKRLSKVHYLLPPTGDTRHRIKELTGEVKWSEVLDSVLRTSPPITDWRGCFELLKAELIRAPERFPDREWFEKNWGEWGSDRTRLLWHLINDAPIGFQVDWYKAHSAVYKSGAVEFHAVFRDSGETRLPGMARELREWLFAKREEIGRPFVNLWGTTTAVQFAWYYWAWQDIGLKDATFLFCMTLKKETGKRFPAFQIRVAEKSIISNLAQPYGIQPWEVKERAEVKKWLESYLEWGDNFCILLLGPRGSGKSQSVRDMANSSMGKDVIEANCANFAEPIHARSELFGHAEGAFTGAKKRDGLLQRANGKILFLDEIHHLDPITRNMLLTALQTDSEGNFSFTPLGGEAPSKVKFQLIVGSNLTLSDLKMKLEPDFFDRIAQRILEMPPLQKSEIEGVWPQIWKRMDFKPEMPDPISDPGFLQWVQAQPLHGNFRDLERIAIAVADYRRAFNAKHGFVKPTLLEHLEQEARRWASADSKEDKVQSGITIEVDLDDKSVTDKTFLWTCRKTFAERMVKRLGNQSKAVNELKARGSKMTKPLFSKWMSSPEK